jgi:hypothetical protein
MSPKNYGKKKTRRTLPYVQKIRLDERIKRKLPKFCPSCKETSDLVNLLYSKVNEIEDVINNFENLRLQ